jgi:hypothetical protein
MTLHVQYLTAPAVSCDNYPSVCGIWLQDFRQAAALLAHVCQQHLLSPPILYIPQENNWSSMVGGSSCSCCSDLSANVPQVEDSSTTPRTCECKNQ